MGCDEDISKLFTGPACILDEAGVKILAFLSPPHFALISLRLVITHDDTLDAGQGEAKIRKKNILSNIELFTLDFILKQEIRHAMSIVQAVTEAPKVLLA